MVGLSKLCNHNLSKLVIQPENCRPPHIYSYIIAICKKKEKKHTLSERDYGTVIQRNMNWQVYKIYVLVFIYKIFSLIFIYTFQNYIKEMYYNIILKISLFFSIPPCPFYNFPLLPFPNVKHGCCNSSFYDRHNIILMIYTTLRGGST